MRKRYIGSLFIGLFLLFQIQLLSYMNYLLINQDVMNGVLDPYLLLKTPLLLIPCVFIAYFVYGVCKEFEKEMMKE